jgi:teichuronic acid biosynthesis glycosyltransferase TuaC
MAMRRHGTLLVMQGTNAMLLASRERRSRGPGGRAAAVRLLTLTTLFPNARRPRHGIFIANRLRMLCDAGHVTSTVIAAVPWFPGHYREMAEVPRMESWSGIPVHHPRYLHVPAVGMRLQPGSLAHAILRELRTAELANAAFDAVDAHYFYPDGVAAAHVARALGLPLVISGRGSDINLIGEISFARKRMLAAARAASALIAVSSALGHKMEALGMPGDRLNVLRNGVDTMLFAPAAHKAARERFRIDDTGPLILGVGNLVPEKGFELLIRAMVDLPRAKLLLVGEGPLRDALRALAQAVAPGRVIFRDNVPQAELRYAYAAANVLALPSLREGWPNVLLESIACGTPVVAAAVGGVPEIVQAGAPGMMLAERSPGNWAHAIGALLAASLAPDKVRMYALQHGWPEIIARQGALYRQVVNEHRFRRTPDGTTSPAMHHG